MKRGIIHGLPNEVLAEDTLAMFVEGSDLYQEQCYPQNKLGREDQACLLLSVCLFSFHGEQCFICHVKHNEIKEINKRGGHKGASFLPEIIL